MSEQFEFVGNHKKNDASKDTDNKNAYFVRHSKSGYKTYAQTEKSENPRAPFDSEKQVTPDLTEEGIELAKRKAEEFFKTLDPTQDKLFFVSSNEARAVETANIYREIASQMGFEIIKPEKTRSKISDEVGNGEIRVLENLSLNPSDTILFNIFLPEKLIRPANWEAVDPEFKRKWDNAREIIKNDDQGSYGGNLHKHSKAIKEFFQEVETTQQLHEKEFKNLLRLVKWAEKKFEIKKNNIKIIAFGHENYVLNVLDESFHEKGINNCETIGISLDDQATITFRDKDVQINV